jgi:hypothetical protein
MRRFFFIILFAGFNTVAYNQIIKGTILENGTKSPISTAAIYYAGTFVGTLSDKSGNFELDISNNPLMPLTISSIGYYSVILNDYSTDNPLIIYLIPKLYELKEVVISSKPLFRKRKEYLKLFKDVFLGTTYNARNCEIINENDITFNYDACQDTLKAISSKPILIDNRALGYKIRYYLDKFEYYKKDGTFFFKGNIIFIEDLKDEKTDKKLSERLYEKRRKNTYLGSRMHFFRALWSDDLESAGFLIKSSVDKYLHTKDIVIQEDSQSMDSPNEQLRYLKYPENLQIYYTSWSNIIFLNPIVNFNKNGRYDDLGIHWEGEMSVKRIGDLLPFEYNESGNKNRY